VPNPSPDPPFNPYEAARVDLSPAEVDRTSRGRQPLTWKIAAAMWFAMSAFGLVGTVINVIVEMSPESNVRGECELPPGVGIALALLFGSAYAVLPFLPRRRWAWFLTLALNIYPATCCTLPIVPFWFRRDVFSYYGIELGRPAGERNDTGKQALTSIPP
jgi:hypothetical protein